jgi:hypothetical protein
VFAYFSLVWPFIAPILAGYLIQSGLREPRVQWWRLLVSVVVIGLLCFSLYADASLGGWGLVGAFVFGFLSACLALAVAIWLAWTLPRWRKLAGPIFCVALVPAMYYSVEAGDWRSPEDTTRRNGDLIIQALDQYHATSGHYPEKLTQLEPTYLATLPEAETTQGTGWLYESDGHDFTLGYWYWPDRWNTRVCLYASPGQTWECGIWNWGPFEGVPTPSPCLTATGDWSDDPRDCVPTPQAPD